MRSFRLIRRLTYPELDHCVSKALLGIVFLFLSSCSQSRNKPTPLDINAGLSSVLAEHADRSSDFESQCMRDQGFKNFEPQQVILTYQEARGVSAASYLLSLSNAELEKRLAKLNTQNEKQQQTEEIQGIRYKKVTIDGVNIEGGCSRWARDRAGEATKYYDLARRILDSPSGVSSPEVAELSLINREIDRCLEPAERKQITDKGVKQALEYQSASFDEIDRILFESNDVFEARKRLSAVDSKYKPVVDRVKICADEVQADKRMEKVRSDSLQLVFDQYDLEEFIEHLTTQKDKGETK
jgi:hypothetical protein